MTDSHRYSVSVAGAVVDGEKVLAVRRRDNGHWEPPGGVLESGERVEDGLLREVREETGLEVAVDSLSGVYQNLERDIIALVYRCHVLGGALRATDETSSFRWLTAPECDEAMDPAYAVRLTDALTSSATKVRAHDGVDLR